MKKSYQTGKSRVRVPALTEPVKVTVMLHPAAAATLNRIRVIECYESYDCEPVPLSIFLSWWICEQLNANCWPTPGGRSAHVEDLYGRLHSVPEAVRIPDVRGTSPGAFIEGVPWWMVQPKSRRDLLAGVQGATPGEVAERAGATKPSGEAVTNSIP